MNRSSTPCVRYHVLLYVIVLGAFIGCGTGDDDSGPPTRTTAFKRSELTKPADSGTFEAHSCDVLDWHGGPVIGVKLMVDSAPRAQLRYYNLLSEQHEYYNADPAMKARQIKGVGDDSAYGGAGAWWTRARNQLVAYDRDKIVKLRVNVRGFRDSEARATAVRLAKRAVRQLRRRA